MLWPISRKIICLLDKRRRSAYTYAKFKKNETVDAEEYAGRVFPRELPVV